MTDLDVKRTSTPPKRDAFVYFAGTKHIHIAIQGASRAYCFVKVQGDVTNVAPITSRGCPRCEVKVTQRYKKASTS